MNAWSRPRPAIRRHQGSPPRPTGSEWLSDRFDELDDKVDCLVPEWSLCSAEGQCVDELDFYGKACKVNGQNYLHGTRDIPGLFGCGSCVCEDGSLIC